MNGIMVLRLRHDSITKSVEMNNNKTIDKKK